jgi:hypothetical protein
MALQNSLKLMVFRYLGNQSKEGLKIKRKDRKSEARELYRKTNDILFVKQKTGVRS